MPEIAAWIDQLRDTFGAEPVNEAMRAGLSGEPSFHAIERGNEIGTPSAAGGSTWRGDGLADRHFCPGCNGECVGTRIRCRAVPGGGTLTSGAGAPDSAHSSDTDK